MNVGEQRELRRWAQQLSTVEDPERRAMGRAISMLLDRIDELERQLHFARQAPAPLSEPALDPDEEPVRMTLDPIDRGDVGEDTQQLRLRDRIRLATDHLRDRD
ncbi:MAG TPA: hypothetical protein VE824_06865 [Gaiellales bacterium]|nr:hypothetical protein [Gaiellales bacterium]